MAQSIESSRRDFCTAAAAASVLGLCTRLRAADDVPPINLRYILSSAMYGKAPLAEIVPEVRKTGATQLDIWPAPHGNQREQVDQLGADAFARLLDDHGAHLGGIACYRFGAFGLRPQMELCKVIGATGVALVCGGSGPKDATGQDLKKAVAAFVEKLKPHHAAAAEHECLISIENHSNNMINSPDSLRWFTEFTGGLPNLGIAFAPHHLPQDAALQAALIDEIGSKIKFFYAQQHGKGSHHKQPREDEMLQMPGRGPLDFAPLIAALRRVQFTGFTEIFMHPFPRGVPILDSNQEITAEINRSRAYLEDCARKANA